MVEKDLVDPGNTAVLVVDIQNDYFSDEGKIATIQKQDLSSTQAIVPKIIDFVDTAREKGLKIIWARMIEDPDYMPANASRMLASESIPCSYCTPGTSGFEYYKVRPRKKDFEIVKKHYNAFTSRKLRRFLWRNKKIKNLIIVGGFTAICINATLMGAFSHGFNVVLLEDLVGMPNEKMHKAGLMVLSNFSFLASSEEVLSLWE